MDFSLASPQEIGTELCLRLKRQRLSQALTQADLAARAGISLGTVKNLEAARNTGLEAVIRVACVLGLAKELQDLFQLKIQTIEELERAEQLPRRIRHSQQRGQGHGPKD